MSVNYEFTGWSFADNNIPEDSALLNVLEDRVVYACWKKGTPEALVSPDGEILNSWEEIAQIVDAGTYKDVFSVGNYKYVDYGSTYGTKVPMEIVGFDVDEIYDEVLYSRPVLNPSITYDAGVADISWEEPLDPLYEGTMIVINEGGTVSIPEKGDNIYAVVKKGEKTSLKFFPSKINTVYNIALLAYSKYGFSLVTYFDEELWSGSPIADADSSPEEATVPEFEKAHAPISWIAKEALKGTYQWNSSSTNVGGYEKSLIRQTLEETIYPSMEDSVKPYFLSVSKTFRVGATDESGTKSGRYKLWLPSHAEICGSSDGPSYSESEGHWYKEAFPTTDERIRKTTESTIAAKWWLRSAYHKSSSNVLQIYNSGFVYDISGATTSLAIVPGFCTGGTPKSYGKVTDDGEILDTWEEIHQACVDGVYSKVYRLLDYKTIKTSEEFGGTLKVMILGFDNVEKSDGTGYAPITWRVSTWLPKQYKWDDTRTQMEIGESFYDTSLCKLLNGRFYDSLEEDVKKYIPSVKKKLVYIADKPATYDSSKYLVDLKEYDLKVCLNDGTDVTYSYVYLSGRQILYRDGGYNYYDYSHPHLIRSKENIEALEYDTYAWTCLIAQGIRDGEYIANRSSAFVMEYIGGPFLNEDHSIQSEENVCPYFWTE